MGTPSSQAQPYFVDSEEWFNTACGGAWVEMGLTDGYNPGTGGGAYNVFVAWETTSKQSSYSPMAYTSPSATNDSYQISRSPYVNQFIAYWDLTGNGSSAAEYLTPNVGFWQGGCLQMGAEVGSPAATASTFNMYGSAVNGAGQLVNWAGLGWARRHSH